MLHLVKPLFCLATGAICWWQWNEVDFSNMWSATFACVSGQLPICYGNIYIVDKEGTRLSGSRVGSLNFTLLLIKPVSL